MKVCVCSYGPTLDSRLQPIFGRCDYFIFVDPLSMEFESSPNSNASALEGAGILSAQFVVNKGVSKVITMSVGPNAKQLLDAAGIEIVALDGESVRETLGIFMDRFLSQTGSSYAGTGEKTISQEAERQDNSELTGGLPERPPKKGFIRCKKKVQKKDLDALRSRNR